MELQKGVSMGFKVKMLIIGIISIFVLNLGALSLDEAIKMAKNNNQQLKADYEEVEKAEYLYRDVRGSLLPQISLNGAVNATKTYMPNSVLSDPMDMVSKLSNTASPDDSLLGYAFDGLVNNMLPNKSTEESAISAQVKFDQVLFLGGKLINGIRVADKYRNLQKKKYELTEEQLVFNVIDNYYQVQLLSEVVNIKAQALSLAKEHFGRVIKLYENGLVSEYDKIRAELEVSKLESEVSQTLNSYQLLEENFKRIIGSTASDSLVLTDQLEQKAYQEESLDKSLEIGLKNRIELYLSGLNVEMMQVQYNAEKGNFLPTVMLTAQAAKFTSSSDYTINHDDFGTMYQAGIVFQVPLFTGLSNSSKIQKTKHELRKAEFSKKDAEEMISLEIRQNWLNLNHSVSDLKVQQKNVETAEKGYQIAKSRYDNQIGIQLEVLDAQIQLNSAKVSYIQALYQYNKNLNSYKKSLGQKLI